MKLRMWPHGRQSSARRLGRGNSARQALPASVCVETEILLDHSLGGVKRCHAFASGRGQVAYLVWLGGEAIQHAGE